MGRMDTGTFSLPMNAVFIDDGAVGRCDEFLDVTVARARAVGEDIGDGGREPVEVGGAMQQVSMLTKIILVVIILS